MFRAQWSRSEIVSLIVLVILVVCTLLVKFQSELAAYVALIGVSILVLNAVFLFLNRVEYSGLIGIYSGYTLFTGFLGALNLLKVGDYLVDLAYVMLLLMVLTIYYYNISIQGVLTAFTPVVLLISVITGVHLELIYPLRYTLLVLLDTFSVIITLTSVKNHAVGVVVSLLLFTLLYSTPFLALSTKVIVALFTLYILKALLVIYNKIRGLRALVSIDLLLRPVLVICL